MKKLNISLIGLIQAAGVLFYCFLIAGFINLLSGFSITPGSFIGPSIMLTLLVVSAAITGTIVFGYPVYLAIKNKIKEAIFLLLYTFLYLISFVFIGIIIVVAMNV